MSKKLVDEQKLYSYASEYLKLCILDTNTRINSISHSQAQYEGLYAKLERLETELSELEDVYP